MSYAIITLFTACLQHTIAISELMGQVAIVFLLLDGSQHSLYGREAGSGSDPRLTQNSKNQRNIQRGPNISEGEIWKTFGRLHTGIYTSRIFRWGFVMLSSQSSVLRAGRIL
ncbi:hypothetical protein BDN70DRAFT_873632 [Pholiota conissans]|uniref:Secreted protein n=1 Tax=Pholiota conissans TaxID=109636 RepID=A0A9P6CY09_9AGAR|nr:hypothetical protein BDN70DRAFT_873632 [Pholiota conissans]